MKAKLYINSEESTIRIEGGPNEVLFLLVDAIAQILEGFFSAQLREADGVGVRASLRHDSCSGQGG